MFTIRFIQHEGGNDTKYKSYTCRAYSVNHNSDGEAKVKMELSGTDEPFIEEQVGDLSPYRIAYVTNSESRTIDVIRPLAEVA